MTNLRQLNVSLTKFGAHKLAKLLRKYDGDEVLNHLWGSETGINIEAAQAKKTLSVGSNGEVPSLWTEVKPLGPKAIDALVLIAIIFSHHRLITTLQQSASRRSFRGSVVRDQPLDSKEFTNIASAFEDLGACSKRTLNHVDYDFRHIVKIKGLSPLVVDLFRLKLRAAGWTGKNNLIDELVALDLHRALAINESDFRAWLAEGRLAPELINDPVEDSDFFLADDDDSPGLPFVFTPGHNPKKTGRVAVAASKQDRVANLLHNEMQTALYKKLSEKYGAEQVRTELPTGFGTSVDVAVKTSKFCWFYEIKTASSVQACVRQAIPQLMEYAYWHGAADRCDRMIIVGPKPITKAADKYLKFLRKNFGLKVYYEDFSVRRQPE